MIQIQTKIGVKFPAEVEASVLDAEEAEGEVGHLVVMVTRL